VSDDRRAERAIMELLAERDPGKTICPSEAARAIGGDERFREHMPEVRDAAGWSLGGELEVTQGGEVVDSDRVRGSIRLRLP